MLARCAQGSSSPLALRQITSARKKSALNFRFSKGNRLFSADKEGFEIGRCPAPRSQSIRYERPPEMHHCLPSLFDMTCREPVASRLEMDSTTLVLTVTARRWQNPMGESVSELLEAVSIATTLGLKRNGSRSSGCNFASSARFLFVTVIDCRRRMFQPSNACDDHRLKR